MNKTLEHIRPVRRSEYKPPDYLVDRVELDIHLDPALTRVCARLEVKRCPAATSVDPPLVLNGELLNLRSIRLNGIAVPAHAYHIDDQNLTIANVPDAFVLETEVEIDPSSNTALEGLYLTNGMFCTQCEAEGFRRITYFPDRPDVLARYRTRITAEKASYPVLLSNGNLMEAGTLEAGRHYAIWDDPFAKPSYLFALVAGDLACVEESYRTMSGRDVALRIYVEHGNENACQYALESLKRAMTWDEETFGLEYDLDIYMIVAVSHFNMGAMENKGLNIFNAKYVLARPETATDDDFAGIESVISHEYFHNWTGNRVTCRDWFQLSLKEGLTVFRDQEFSADQRSRPVCRIADVKRLRARQFVEDAGPLAHPVRPESYVEINNFYTPTVYEKGAEIVRMIRTLLGPATFREGLRRYLADHDGEAATIEDFLSAMEAVSGRDLAQFSLWYEQSGTPILDAEQAYNPDRREFTLTLTQRCDPTPGQPIKRPFHIPVAIGLVDPDGTDTALHIVGSETDSAPSQIVLDFTQSTQTFVFTDVPGGVSLSLLRDFSAPVKIAMAPEPDCAQFLAAQDPNAFNRWENGQKVVVEHLINAVSAFRSSAPKPSADGVLNVFGAILNDDEIDDDYRALALTLPSEADIALQLKVVDVEAIHRTREDLLLQIAMVHRDKLADIYHRPATAEHYSPDARQAGHRSLRNRVLGYLTKIDNSDLRRLVISHYSSASNMTDTFAALSILSDLDLDEREAILEHFYSKWRHNPLVLDKWFSVQATSNRPDTLAKVKGLLKHQAFDYKTPNRVRALIGAFCANSQLRFNAADGSGYRFLADQVLILDDVNAQIAATLLTAFERWRRLDRERQSLVQAQLDRILAKKDLSRDVKDIATRTLS